MEQTKLLINPSKPSDIPSAPANVYKVKGWINLGDWLGKE